MKDTSLKRLVICARRIYEGERLSRFRLQEDYGISRPTAKRDIRLLQEVLPTDVYFDRIGSKVIKLRVNP